MRAVYFAFIIALLVALITPLTYAKTTVAKPIVVAVIDTGADILHKAIRSNLWINPGESGKDSKGRMKETNGVDDDKNGFIDDVHGWNFINNSNRLTDKNGHGTHIAGIIVKDTLPKSIQSVVDKNEMPQVSSRIEIMVLKYYDDAASAQNALANTIQAIRYANKMNVDIINYSGGGIQPSEFERLAIKESNKNNILFIAAAGNEHSNSDTNKYYPADYELPNILSVTAHDSKNKILDSSNFGKETVDIAALGKDVLSAFPNGRSEIMTGTSQATAMATQAAALLMARQSAYRKNPAELIHHLLATGAVENQFLNKVRSSARLELQKTLKIRRADISAWGAKVENFDNIQQGKFWDMNNLGNGGVLQ